MPGTEGTTRVTLTVGRVVRVAITVTGLAALGLGLADTAHAAEINPTVSDGHLDCGDDGDGGGSPSYDMAGGYGGDDDCEVDSGDHETPTEDDYRRTARPLSILCGGDRRRDGFRPRTPRS